MAVDNKIIDEILKDYKNPEDLTGEKGILKELFGKLIERALDGEIEHHLGYSKHSKDGYNSGNSRNGKTSKTIKTDLGEVEVSIPRDRNSEFEPKIVKKNQRRFNGFDDKIIAMYARGMTTHDIKAHLKDIYNTEVSSDFISNVTDSIMDEVTLWQNRPLESLYFVLYMDCIVIKIRNESGHIVNKSVYHLIGINKHGLKDHLGIWIEETEGAKFWLKVLTEIKNRGVEDILIACVDGLKGFPEAIQTVYPQAQVQLCIVHMVRNSLRYVSWKERKEVASDLKKIYQSPTIELAEVELINFEKKWDKKYPLISKSWRRNWVLLTTFIAYPPDIRKIIYTTNAIESLNNGIRKVIKNRPSFPNDKAVEKILYLAIQNISKKWTMPIREWGSALNHFVILFGDRIQIE